MADIGVTVNLDGAYLSRPSVPANGQEGTSANSIAFTGTLITKSLTISDDIKTTLFVEKQVAVLPTITLIYYHLAATLIAGNTREYWTDLTPSLTNSPSGSEAYVPGTFIIIGSFS
jgi:hypothetical protein